MGKRHPSQTLYFQRNPHAMWFLTAKQRVRGVFYGTGITTLYVGGGESNKNAHRMILSPIKFQIKGT